MVNEVDQAQDQATPEDKPRDADKPENGLKVSDKRLLPLLLLILFSAAILISISLDYPVIRRISDPAYARGLITFIICLATIGLAFTLVFQAFFTQNANEDRFKRAREVFVGLMGILGTIVGFYFGAATESADHLEFLKVLTTNSSVVVCVTGGAPPYQCSLSISGEKPNGAKFADIAELESEDGWIHYDFGSKLDTGEVEIEVTDSKKQELVRKKRITKESE